MSEFFVRRPILDLGAFGDQTGPTVVRSPTRGLSSANSNLGKTSRRCSTRLDLARIRTTAMSKFVRSCCAPNSRSTVISTSKTFSASASKSPFLIPDQPDFCTVVTSWPAKSRANRWSMHSSSKIFTSPQRPAYAPWLVQGTRSPARASQSENLPKSLRCFHRLRGSRSNFESVPASLQSTAYHS